MLQDLILSPSCWQVTKSNLIQNDKVEYLMLFSKCAGNFMDCGVCSCDTRKCLTPIVERQKIVLIPLWEGREGQGRNMGGGIVGVF